MRIRHADINVDEWESPKGCFGNIGRAHTSSGETVSAQTALLSSHSLVTSMPKPGASLGMR